MRRNEQESNSRTPNTVVRLVLRGWEGGREGIFRCEEGRDEMGPARLQNLTET